MCYNEDIISHNAGREEKKNSSDEFLAREELENTFSWAQKRPEAQICLFKDLQPSFLATHVALQKKRRIRKRNVTGLSNETMSRVWSQPFRIPFSTIETIKSLIGFVLASQGRSFCFCEQSQAGFAGQRSEGFGHF